MIAFRPRFAAAVFVLGLLAAAGRTHAQTTTQLTWGASGAGGSGTWSTDTTNVDWYNGTANVPWTNGDTALFAGTAGTVSILGAVTTPQVTFSTAGYTIQDFFLEGTSNGLTVETDADATISSSIFGSTSNGAATPFNKTGSGVLTFTEEGPVFFGSVNINAGEVRFTGTGSPEYNTPYVLANAAGVALTFASTSNDLGSLAGGGTAGGVVRPNVTTGQLTLTIEGSSAASFGGTLQDNGSATLALTKYGTSTQTLTGANTYSGATAVSGTTLVSVGSAILQSSTLTLAGANGSILNTLSVAASNGGILVLDNTAASNGNRLASGVAVNLSSGTISLLGNAATDTTQTVGALSFSGASTVSVTPAGTAAAQLVLTSLTRQNKGTISFSDGGNVTATGLTNTNGIVGGYATVNGTDWATVDGTGRVSAYTGYTSDLTTATGTDNLRIVTSNGNGGTLPATQTRNSLNLVNTGSSTAVFQIGPTQTLTLASGGLLTSGSAGFLIQNGTLTTSGSELIVTNQAALTMAATVADGASAVALTKSGAGTLALTGNNTYTGPTTVVQGTLQAATDANLGAGSVVAINGGTLQATASFTSSKSLQGGGGTMDTGSNSVAFNGGSNTGSVNKIGTGMLSLTGTVGNVIVESGVLHLTNLATNNAAYVTLFGGRLEASGSGVQNVQSFGSSSEISPGSIGQAAALTIGTLNAFGSGSTVIDFDLGSSAKDSIIINSNVEISGGGSTTPVLFRFSNLGGTTTGTAYSLLTLPANSFNVSASQFGIDSTSTAAGYKGTFSLANNTLSVTFTAVPEPGAATWLLGALGIWSVSKRLSSRRKKPTLA